MTCSSIYGDGNSMWILHLVYIGHEFITRLVINNQVAGYKWVINCPAERENEVLPRQRVYVYFSFQKQILFTIISTLSKNKQKSMGEVNTIFGRENFPSKL